MIFAKLPFEDDNTSILYSKIKSGLYVIDKKVSPEYKDLLSKMLNVKPKQRITLPLLKEHPWYKKFNGPKCNGVMVGFENVPIDLQIIDEINSLGYDGQKCQKYLENNIRNEMTTAYYLLIKRNFKKGIPSAYDLCSDDFNKKVLQPKKSNILIRSHSSAARYATPNKETIQFEDEINPFINIKRSTQASEPYPNKYKKFTESAYRRERKCFSQIKSEEYDQHSFKSKPSHYILGRYGKTHATSLSKSIKNHR